MEMQERTERELDLKEIFWGILFHWRQIVCFGIIFAILVSGVKYLRDMRSYQLAQNAENTQQEELAEDEMQQVIEARHLMSRIKEYEDYLENSALMQMNLYEKPVIELQYYVDSDYTFNYTQESQNDYTDDLLVMYCSFIMSGEMGNKVIEEADLSVDLADFSEFWVVGKNENSISIKVTCPEEKKMKTVAESIKAQLKKKEAEFQEIGSHKLKLMVESENVVVDNNLIDRKNTISNNIATINTQLNTLKTNLSEQQMKLLKNGKEEIENTDLKCSMLPNCVLFGYKFYFT